MSALFFERGASGEVQVDGEGGKHIFIYDFRLWISVT